MNTEDLLSQYEQLLRYEANKVYQRIPFGLVGFADILQEVKVGMVEQFDYISEQPIELQGGYIRTIARARAGRCLRWLIPQLPKDSIPKRQEGDKTVYDNDWQSSMTGARAVAYSHAEESGEPFDAEESGQPFDIEDY